MNETKMQLNQLNIELNNKHKIFELYYIEYTRGSSTTHIYKKTNVDFTHMHLGMKPTRINQGFSLKFERKLAPKGCLSTASPHKNETKFIYIHNGKTVNTGTKLGLKCVLRCGARKCENVYSPLDRRNCAAA